MDKCLCAPVTNDMWCMCQAAAWCALNGVGLALVMPCVQSIIAEVYRAKSRGRAFGIIFTTSALGE